MNWTGGRLSRHSRSAAGGLTQRQKQHFARKRNNVGNGLPKRSPLEGAAPTEIEESLIPGNRSRTISHPQEIYKLEILYSSPNHGLVQRRGSSTSLPSVEDEFLEYDIYNASPPPPVSLPKSKRGPSGSQARDSKSMEGKETVEQKRKKLLERVDWTGISIQRPIRLVYESVGTRGGRRRKLSDGQQHNVRLEQGAASPFIDPANSGLVTAFRAAKRKNNHWKQSDWGVERGDDLRISIGGKQLHTRKRPKLQRNNAQTDYFQQSSEYQSDDMLLDEDGPIGQEAHHFRRQELCSKSELAALEELEAQTRNWGSQPASKAIDSQSRISLLCRRATAASDFDTPTRRSLSQDPRNSIYTSSLPWTELEPPSLAKRKDHICQSRNIFRTLSHHGSSWNLSSTNACGSELEVAHGGRVGEIDTRSRNSFVSSPHPGLIRARIHASKNAQNLHRVPRSDSQMLIVRSSPAEFYHPRPQLARSKILDSDPLNIGSTIARLGTPQPIIPPSQAPDEETWRRWIYSLKDSEPESTEVHGQGENHRSISISPGISVLAHRAERCDRLSETTSSMPGSQRRMDKKVASSGGQKQTTIHVYSGENETLGKKEEACTKEPGPPAPTSNRINTFLPRPKDGITKATEKSGDEEKAWRIFIFSSDDESDDEKPIESQWRTALPLVRSEITRKDLSRSHQTEPSSSPRHLCTESPGSTASDSTM